MVAEYQLSSSLQHFTIILLNQLDLWIQNLKLKKPLDYLSILKCWWTLWWWSQMFLMLFFINSLELIARQFCNLLYLIVPVVWKFQVFISTNNGRDIIKLSMWSSCFRGYEMNAVKFNDTLIIKGNELFGICFLPMYTYK